MLDALIERHSLGALVTVSPYLNDEGETLRWFVELDGEPENSLDVRVTPVPPDLMVMTLICDGQEIEIQRWKTSVERHGPAAVIRTLRELQSLS